MHAVFIDSLRNLFFYINIFNRLRLGFADYSADWSVGASLAFLSLLNLIVNQGAVVFEGYFSVIIDLGFYFLSGHDNIFRVVEFL